MSRAVFNVAAALLFVAAVCSEAGAQFFKGPAPGSEVGSITIKAGLLAPQTTFTDESFGESSFDNGLAVGFAASAWPLLGRRLGLRGQMTRARTAGSNATSELAPLAINDPTVWMYTLELAVRQPVPLGSVMSIPSLALGYGGKQYTWAVSQHKSSRFANWTAAAGVEFRPAALGAFGITTEARAYRSNFRAFGIDDGSWEPGFYGGNVGGVENLDLLFSTGVSLNF